MNVVHRNQCSSMISAGRKRPHSPETNDEHSCERNKCYITYVLDSESPQPTDEDSESSHSVQMAGTASPKDTTDTSWTSDSVTMDVEFEEYDVASVIHSDEKLMSNCDSSGTDDMLHTATAATVLMATNFHEEQDLWADSSDLSSDATTDSEVPRADYWECLRCKSKCTPLTRYCIKCFQLRKGYFPERPKRTHPRRRRKVAKVSPAGTAEADPTMPDTDQALSPGSDAPDEQPAGKLEKGDSGISLSMVEEKSGPDSTRSGESQELILSSQDTMPPEEADREPETPDSRSELCFMCVTRPRNGGFIHKKTVHVLCCYQCSLQVWNRTRKCPLCNKRPQNVARLIYG